MTFGITKSFTFAAAHHLDHLPVQHKCRRPHGHNYVVTVILEAEELDPDSFVEDYGELADIKSYIDAYLDHRDLNEALVGVVPTAECLAHMLFDRFTAAHPALCQVVVSETPATTASYRR